MNPDMICRFCGKEKVWGAGTQATKERMVEWRMKVYTDRALAEKDTDEYIMARPDLYFECETEHNKVTMIPIDQLEHGCYYTGHCRNASVARWNAETRRFVYMREKFGQVYPEDIEYWVEALPGQHKFDEYKPYCKIEPPFEIPLIVR